MSSQTWRQNWVGEKCNVATRLSCGEAGGGYPEAAIIVCAALSALSAELWCGRGIDRVRFIEMLVQFGVYSNECKTISIPLLVQHLNDTSRGSDAQKIRSAFSLPGGALVLTGPDIDRSEQDVLSVCQHLEINEVRSFSYASILYGEIRSSYAHEYRPGARADSWPMTKLADQRVSYINRIMDSLEVQRFVHIHVGWITQLAIDIASAIDQLESSLPLQRPEIWWADGASPDAL